MTIHGDNDRLAQAQAVAADLAEAFKPGAARLPMRPADDEWVEDAIERRNESRIAGREDREP